MVVVSSSMRTTRARTTPAGEDMVAWAPSLGLLNCASAAVHDSRTRMFSSRRCSVSFSTAPAAIMARRPLRSMERAHRTSAESHRTSGVGSSISVTSDTHAPLAMACPFCSCVVSSPRRTRRASARLSLTSTSSARFAHSFGTARLPYAHAISSGMTPSGNGSVRSGCLSLRCSLALYRLAWLCIVAPGCALASLFSCTAEARLA
mmetsp:Transcript_22765/g.70714  ORF Transcript_22765/g.70714 Transcript_22765/m.70714 type:complete len:205 (-) Transcript_22765:71-685(-)